MFKKYQRFIWGESNIYLFYKPFSKNILRNEIVNNGAIEFIL